MAEAYIVDAVRSPTGRRRGSLAEVHGADLGAHVLRTLVDRNDIPDVDYAAVDHRYARLEHLCYTEGRTVPV